MAPIKPEAALDKAKKMYNIDKTEAAIELLSECMKAQKKQKAWTKVHEDLMMFLAELCVESKKSLQFKEVIHQYKNMTAQVNPKSLEDVVKRYLNLAETRTEQAREQSKEIIPDIEDLECPETPESLMLSVVNAEAEQDRQDRTILTPWLKFLWESYRQCLELLRNNPRFERQYHDIVHDISIFCRKYDRKTEFKKLSEILRNHMSKLQNNIALSLNNVPQAGTTNADSWGLHHETRLKLLDDDLNFQLYNEAFRKVEDIWNLLNTATVPVKPRITASYYAKTARVFFESGSSYLFHAAALHRLFFFSKENKKNISSTELERMATHLVIASIAVPLPNIREAVDSLLESGEITSPVKQKQLSVLLKLPNPPTRSSLIRDISTSRVHELVNPALNQLFKMLEFDYKPLSMAREAHGVLAWLETHTDYHVYTDLIKETIVSKVLIQTGKVYKTIKISEFEKLCPFVSSRKLLSIIANLIRNLELPINVDHRSGVLKFDVYTDLGISQRNDSELITEEINGISSLARQLSKFSAAIYEVGDFIGYQDHRKQDSREWIRQSYMHTMQESHVAMMARKVQIESRKEEIEQLEEEHTKMMNETLRLQEEKRRKEESIKLKEERDQQQVRQMRLEEEMNKKRILQARKEYLKTTESGIEVLKNYTEEEIEKMDEVQLAKMHTEERQKMKETGQEKVRKLEQKIDYFHRALRLKEITAIDDAQNEFYRKAKTFYAENEVLRKQKSVELHNMKLLDRDLCLNVNDDASKYVKIEQQGSNVEYKSKLDEYECECERIKQDYRSSRIQELKEEMEVIMKEEEQRMKEEEARKELEQASQKSKAYVPPSLRGKTAAAAPIKNPTPVDHRNSPKSVRTTDENGWRSSKR